MCDLCFIPRCDCDAALATGEAIGPNAANGSAVLDNPAPTVTDARALDSTRYWTGDTVSYGFPDSAAGFTGGLSSYSPYNEPGSRLTLSDFGRDTLREGFAQWDAVTTLTIAEAAPRSMAQINVGASSAPSTAWAYYPGSQVASGDIWFNTGKWFLDALADAPAPVIGSYAYATGMHEFGHALGLKHPHQTSGGGTAILDPAYDAVEFSIMSYRSYPGGPAGSYSIESWGYPQSPMMLDIAMIQRIYGADYTALAGDTTYTVSTTTGEMFVDGVSQGVPGGNRVFRTLWDGDGTDHIDLSSYTTSMHADLNPGRGIEFDTGGNFQAARLASGVHAGFNIYMSLLHDGDTRSLIENLTTGAGDDILIGNAADNRLDGGAGVNTVIYEGLSTDYTINVDTGRVTGAATGTDTLVNIDFITFDDTILALDAEVRVVTIGATQLMVDGAAYDIVDLAASQQGVATLTLTADGTAVTLTDNGWAAVLGDFTIAADTVLRFTFAADTLGEIHGIGFTNGDQLSETTTFQLAGTQSWGLQDTAWAYTPGTGPATVEIAVGAHFTGSFDRMVFAMDDDEWVGADSTFADIVLDSQTQVPVVTTATTQLMVDGAAYDVVDFAVRQQGTGTRALTADGTAVTLTDNGWAAVLGDFTIAADTVLRFTFEADTLGEIHGIGFSNNDRVSAGTTFQLAGTQSWGLEDAAWAYTPGTGPATVEIAVGAHFTGSFDRMVFAMDDDEWVGADSTFADIVLDSGAAVGAALRDPVEDPVIPPVHSPGMDMFDFYDIA